MKNSSYATVLDYIDANWDRSIYRDANGSGFDGVDLPYPYTSPCIAGEGHFSFFFYWDTYFTNVGLLKCGRADVAKSNITNIVWFIENQGYMPNHPAIWNRSQPAFLCRMVRDYFEFTDDSDEAFRKRCIHAIRAEYDFWMLARCSPTGLTRHGHHGDAATSVAFYDKFYDRIGLPQDVPEAEKIRSGGHSLAEAETGWDFNPRFGGRCMDFNEVTINALLYEYEIFLAEHAPRYGWTLVDYAKNARLRRERMTHWLWNSERRLFLDYDFVNGVSSSIAALAGFVPLFTGVATPEQAAHQRDGLPLFEREFGIAVTEEYDSAIAHQWAFPKCWPPLVYMTVEGLRRYGFHDDAARIARKYLDTNARLFAATGKLWEKTNALTGEIDTTEYAAAPMLGWSAGVFVAFA